MNDSHRTNGRPCPVVLCILDGWGAREPADDNAIAMARTPNWDRYTNSFPMARLEASSRDVGLPEGQMGNSEVGHMNLGAGRVVVQSLPQIDDAVADGSLAANPVLGNLIGALKDSGGTCHLMGLLSPGGVHSHQVHIAALAKIVAGAGVPVAVHLFLDGRDTPPSSAVGYLHTFMVDITDCENVTVATVSGRYFAMDRDKRWDRVEKAFRVLADAAGEVAASPLDVIERAYANGTTDEFVLPTAIGDYRGMLDGDGLLVANFRADRAREILAALDDPNFKEFARPRAIDFAVRVGMTEYSAALNKRFGTLFPARSLNNILGQIVSDCGLTQLRIAETEKYAHVTFFLNGGREDEFRGEERILVPSPKVATYDLQPEMSASGVTDKLVEAIESGRFDFIAVNYANGDMVGHTGDLQAAIKAAETVDECLGRVEAAVVQAGGTMLVTADHGNLERMTDVESGQAHTAHTTNLVPAILVNPPDGVQGLKDGRLADVAPTILSLMKLSQPADMTGHSLIDFGGAKTAAAQ
jgi:2,3-bisphosphoglycerate-independent phosphoglycerate mutase